MIGSRRFSVSVMETWRPSQMESEEWNHAGQQTGARRADGAGYQLRPLCPDRDQRIDASCGIETVAVDIPSKTVRVAFDPTRVDIERMASILAAEDYPVAAVQTTGQ